MRIFVNFFTWTKFRAKHALQFDIFRFGIVGAVGFLVNLILLSAIHKKLGLNITISQLISAECALLSNFVFHTTWTYKGHSHVPVWKKLIKFHMSSWSGVILSTVIVTVGVNVYHKSYVVSLIVAAAIVMVWNYLWTKHYIFKAETMPDKELDEEIEELA